MWTAGCASALKDFLGTEGHLQPQLRKQAAVLRTPRHVEDALSSRRGSARSARVATFLRAQAFHAISFICGYIGVNYIGIMEKNMEAMGVIWG